MFGRKILLQCPRILHDQKHIDNILKEITVILNSNFPRPHITSSGRLSPTPTQSPDTVSSSSPIGSRSTRRLLLPLQMPFHDLLKDPFAIPNNSIPVTRHNVLESPRIDLLHALVESRPVPFAKDVPQHSLLPRCRTARILNPHKQL